MSNMTTNGYVLTPKFWLWMAEQAKTEQEKEQCLEMALQAAIEVRKVTNEGR